MRSIRTLSTLTALAFFGSTQIGMAAQASTGCCMTRANLQSAWSEHNASFRDCQRLNVERDGSGDKLLERTGLVWWNIRC
ncbi:MAG: hypothetical protein AAFN27_16275 [Pseudomonadota bacterium]